MRVLQQDYKAHGWNRPTVTLYGRVAAGWLGKISFPDPYDLHFSIAIDDAYSGIKVIDGQPSMMEAGYQNFFLIKTNLYENARPAEVKVRIPLEQPSGMSRQEFNGIRAARFNPRIPIARMGKSATSALL